IASRKRRLPFIQRFDFTLGVGLLIVLEEVVFFLTLPVLGRLRRQKAQTQSSNDPNPIRHGYCILVTTYLQGTPGTLPATLPVTLDTGGRRQVSFWKMGTAYSVHSNAGRRVRSLREGT